MPFAAKRVLRSNEINITLWEQGEGPAVVLCHGFPELAYSWRHQLPPLAGAGFRAIAPDQRGFGETDRPEAIEAYDIHHLTGDLVGILDGLGIEKAVFVGHDWGGLIVWLMPLLHPGRTAGVIGVNTPYLPRAPMAPLSLLRAMFGENYYVLHFQAPGVADAGLGRDPRRVFTQLMRSGVPMERIAERRAADGGRMRNMVEIVEMPEPLGDPLLTDDEISVYEAAFRRTGFTGGINWYRNIDRNWETTPQLAGAKIEVPSLMVAAELDPVLRPELVEPMRALVPDLEVAIIPACGHWTQQERPQELNRLMIDWLGRRFGSAAS